MRLAQLQETRQQQTQRVDPRQILASEILAWTTEEAEAAIEREVEENPALEVRESEERPVLVPERASFFSTFFGATEGAAENGDPFERVPSNISLREHLRGQVGQVRRGVSEELLRYLIESVDDRGYLLCEPDEVAERFRLTRSQVEEAVKALQRMDPAGVGARDVQECLALQIEYLEQLGESHPLGKQILQSCWDELITHQEDKIVRRLKTTPERVHAALQFLQNALTPYPGSLFRPSDHQGNPPAPLVRPDLLFLRTETGFQVELVRDFEQLVSVTPAWRQLAEENPPTDEAMRRYVRDHLDRAQSFLAGLARRGRTLRAIGREIAQVQVGYLETRNRAFLKPLTRQALAETLQLDESVISRAVADKWAQLPSGEIVSLDSFFGSSQAVREALLHLVAAEPQDAPYSDEELAALLTEKGFPLARRTVAKYRSQERILSARLRKRKAS